MIISGTNISTYGLKLMQLPDWMNAPARKKILTEPGFETADIKFQEQIITVELFGRYASIAERENQVNAFKAKILSAVEHSIYFVNHGFAGSCIFSQGGEFKPRLNTIYITIKISVIQ